jgi:hypothetical protein
MNTFAVGITLIYAFTPASAGAATAAGDQPSARPLTLAQAAPQPAAGGMASPAAAPLNSETVADGSVRQAAPLHRDLSLWGVLPYSYGGFGFGVGARFALPLPIPSLLPPGRIRDNWSIEFGADYVRFSLGYLSSDYTVNWLLPVVGVRWNVWLSDNFAVYPKAEAGYEIAWISGFPSGYSAPGYGGVFVGGAAGLLYKVGSGNLTLRAEAGNFGLKGGVGFVF